MLGRQYLVPYALKWFTDVEETFTVQARGIHGWRFCPFILLLFNFKITFILQLFSHTGELRWWRIHPRWFAEIHSVKCSYDTAFHIFSCRSTSIKQADFRLKNHIPAPYSSWPVFISGFPLSLTFSSYRWAFASYNRFVTESHFSLRGRASFSRGWGCLLPSLFVSGQLYPKRKK